MGIIIRPWQKSDIRSIREITWQSWISTYSSFIPESDLRSYFDIHYTEASLLSMLDDPFTQGFVAKADDQVAGYARLYFNRDENHLYVSSLYLLAEFQGQEIGRQLLEAAEGYAAEKGFDELWIGVMVKNTQALLFYRKVGFIFVREEPFIMGKTTVNHLIGYKKLGRSMLLDQKIYTTFDGKESLPELCLELLAEQKKTWPDLREGCESLKDVRERELPCSRFSVLLQYNPRRIKSSTALVGEKNQPFDYPRSKARGLSLGLRLRRAQSSRSGRRLRVDTERHFQPRPKGRGLGPSKYQNAKPCFLCLDHLPQGQKGILYRDAYLILCNPMPVFPSHFTISHLDHRAQAIAEHIRTFLDCLVDFGPGWTLLYNGPKCGASAPDHLHFQVAPSGQMPIENKTREGKGLFLVRQVDGVLLHRARDLGREVVILEGDDPIAVEGVFKGFLKGLREVLLIGEEPMMNIAGLYEERKWRLLIFPRRKHRPKAFFKEGDARIVVSPGVIDMGGILITPVEKDFIRLDAAGVERIYREVSLEGKIVEAAIDAMR
jgi:ribosomal protein S18 acetylase RimI-like enzyme